LSGLARGRRMQERVLSQHAELVRLRGMRSELRSTLRRLEGSIAPGLWLIRSESFARRWGTALPQHLRDTQKPARRADRLRGLVQRFRRIIMGVQIVMIPRGAQSTCDLVAISKDGTILLFDRPAWSVERRYPSSVDSSYLDHRNALSLFLPTPAMTMSSDRRVLTEELLDGQLLSSCAPEAKLAVFQTLAEGYAKMFAATHYNAECLEAMAAVSTSDSSAYTTEWPRTQTGSELVRVMFSWTWFMSHGDLSAKNIIVGPRGATLIDFDDMALRPWFFDLVLLAMRDEFLGKLLVRGDLNIELAKIDAAALIVEDLPQMMEFVFGQVCTDRSSKTGDPISVSARYIGAQMNHLAWRPRGIFEAE
jgi:hypothetical protein